jgi:tRNA G18 (ribose-2'-O)-methylase SpoU
MSERSRSVVLSTADLRRSKCDRNSFSKMPRLPVTVVLDQVRHAYNIGAIFRLCDANLVESLVVAGVEVNLRNRHLVRAAQGTQHWTPWAQVEAADIAVARAKADGYQVVVIEQASHSIRLEDFVPAFPVCVVLGGERGGVSPQVLRLADAVIEIPMRGMANSINVATAAAIVLYAISSRATVLTAIRPISCRTKFD